MSRAIAFATTLAVFFIGQIANAAPALNHREAVCRRDSHLSSPRDFRCTMLFEGRQRTFLVHLPPNYNGTSAVPLVMCLHGGVDNGEHFAETSRLNEAADRNGFIAVYPSGTGRFHKWLVWNTGECCGYGYKHKVNDVGFLSSVVQYLKAQYKVDPARVYATGFSIGGQMAYKLAIELPGVFAAIAPISGWMTCEDLAAACPISIITMHGTSDRSIPLTGAKGKWDKLGVHLHALPLSQTISYWANEDRCRWRRIAANGPVVSELLTGGTNDSEIRVELLRGYGHAWPGGKRSWLLAPKPAPWISANDEMWAFFQRHHM